MTFALYQRQKKLEEICCLMRDWGFKWNFEAAAKLKEKHQALRDEAAAPLIKLASRLGLPDLNLASNAQLAKLYFNIFKVAPVAWSKKTGKPSLDGDVLVHYVSCDNKMASQFSKRLLDVREQDKLLGTYIEGCKPWPGRTTVHGEWKSTGAETMRFSCPGVPLQTFPKSMRPLLKARDDCYLAETDKSQLEVRTIAVLANIRLFREVYDRGGDVYMELARRMFNKPFLERGTDEGEKFRQLSKGTTLSCNYKIGDDKLHRKFYGDDDIRKIFPDLSQKQTSALKRAYLDSVPELPVWWQKIEEEAARTGIYLEPVSGRKIEFFGPVDGSFIAAFKNQTLGSHLMNEAFVKIYEDIDKPKEQIKIQCHDAVVLEGPDGKRLQNIMEKRMTEDITIEGRTIHLPCETKISSLGGSYLEVK